MLVAILALAVAPVTDWAPMYAAAEKYGVCAYTKAAPYMKTKMTTEAIVQKAMASCASESQFLESETRRVFEPFSESKADLDQSVNEQVNKQRDLMRNLLIKTLNERR